MSRPRLWDPNEFFGDYLTEFGEQLFAESGHRPSDRQVAQALEVPLASTQRLRACNERLIQNALAMGLRVFIQVPRNADPAWLQERSMGSPMPEGVE